MADEPTNAVLAEKIDSLVTAFSEFRKEGGPKCQVHEEKLKQGNKAFEKIWKRIGLHEKAIVIGVLIGTGVKYIVS